MINIKDMLNTYWFGSVEEPRMYFVLTNKQGKYK